MDLIPKIKMGIFSGSPRMTRQDILFWGVVGGVALLLCLLLWDWYVFSSTLHREETVIAPASLKRSMLSKEELDEAISILNKREEKFHELRAP